MKPIRIMLLTAALLCACLTGCGGQNAASDEHDAAPVNEDAQMEEAQENETQDNEIQEESAAETGKKLSVAEKGTAVTVMKSSDWAGEYPEIYASFMQNGENDEIHDYVEMYPMIAKVYEGMAFNQFYGSARSHTYNVEDVTSTGRPHAMANCFTCKTPQFNVLVNEKGDEVYKMPFEEMQAMITEGMSCYSCHANTPGEFVITNTYAADGAGDDLDSIPPQTMVCAQCHVEYYFDADTKATKVPYHDLESISPDAILQYYNEEYLVDGQPFSDYTNPRTGVRQIKVQHPEYETFMGEGSVHKSNFTCADCHMGTAVSEDGTTYPNHYWRSPLQNQELLDNTCSVCHEDLAADVKAIQDAMEERTIDIGGRLEHLTDHLAEVVESGRYTDEDLEEIRALARDAQFYWDFVFVENSEGAHNSKLDNNCLDKALELVNQAQSLVDNLE